jgi:hypothetical protein
MNSVLAVEKRGRDRDKERQKKRTNQKESD